MSGLLRKVVIWLAVAIVALAIAAAGSVTVSAVTLPGCEACHLTGVFGADTAASPHGSVACVDCHVDKRAAGRIGFATRQVFQMVIPLIRDTDRGFADVSRERCLGCHDHVQAGTVSESNGLRIIHAKCAPGTSCTTCHSVTAHGASTRWPRTSTMESCYECHKDSRNVASCDSCHADRESRERISSGSFRVTHGPEWETTHGMGDTATCSACHDDTKCGSCHGVGVPHEGDFLEAHSKFSLDKGAKCTSCHTKRFCSDCHGYPMPHTVKFTLDHAKTVEKDGEKKCLRCHDKADCTTCHVDHVHPVTLEQMRGFMLQDGGE